MFLEVDGRHVKTRMIGHQMAMSSRGVTQRLEMSVDRRLRAGMVEQAVDVMVSKIQYQYCTGTGQGFTSHSTQNTSFCRRSRSKANLLAWYGKTKPNPTKAHIHQSEEMYYNTK